MDDSSFAHIANLVPNSCSKQAQDSHTTRKKLFREVLEKRKIPIHGWDATSVRLFLSEVSSMDSNNFVGQIGVGEREGRLFSKALSSLHMGLAHGIGRSGDVLAIQPKAAGSSLVNRLSASLAFDALNLAGLSRACCGAVFPVATGMMIMLCLLYVKSCRPKARHVIWTRVDQKSCLKAILSSGLEPCVIESVLEGDQLVCDCSAVEENISALGSENVACVITTTSCFSPRAPDHIPSVARLCKTAGIPHLVNNAYGIQIKRCVNLINEGLRVGRVDAVVQSTDKNFLVPVGGSILACSDKIFLSGVAQMYPGRASGAPALDLLVTLLEMGVSGLKRLWSEREKTFGHLQKKLGQIAALHGMTVLQTPDNYISLALDLTKYTTKPGLAKSIGSSLFWKRVSGARVVVPGEVKKIGDLTFEDYGTHKTGFPKAYLNCAAAIGMQPFEVDEFVDRLAKVLKKADKQLNTDTP